MTQKVRIFDQSEEIKQQYPWQNVKTEELGWEQKELRGVSIKNPSPK